MIENTCLHGLGVCAKCRWAHGCDKCSPEKYLRYHLTWAQLIERDLTAAQKNSIKADESNKTGGGEDFFNYNKFQLIEIKN